MKGVLMPEDSEIDGLVSDSTFDRCRCCYRFLANDMFTQSQKNRKDPGNLACKDCVIQQNSRKEDINEAKGNRHRLRLMFLQKGCDRDKRMSSSIEEKVQGEEVAKVNSPAGDAPTDIYGKHLAEKRRNLSWGQAGKHTPGRVCAASRRLCMCVLHLSPSLPSIAFSLSRSRSLRPSPSSPPSLVLLDRVRVCCAWQG